MTADVVNREIQIHLHEQVGPLRERMSRLEGRADNTDRELMLLRQSMDQVRDRLDDVKNDIMTAIEKNLDKLVQAFHTHEKIDFEKDDDILDRVGRLDVRVAELDQKIGSLKSWIVALGLGAAGLIAVIQLIDRLGAFK